jgi:hypothetical protein
LRRAVVAVAVIHHQFIGAQPHVALGDIDIATEDACWRSCSTSRLSAAISIGRLELFELLPRRWPGKP